MVLAHLKQPLPALRPLVRGWLPAELERLIAMILEKHPDDRPVSARAIAEALRAIPIPDEHAWTAERAAAWWETNRPRRPSAPAIDVTTGPRVIIEGRIHPTL